MNYQHKKYINRAFYLAQKGMGSVAPNPMVGCVIVKNENIIGEGYHKKFGKPHAEINAIKSVKNKKTIEGSSIYITLEPCSHYGKTPPCVDEIINYKPKEVIISNKDPNPKINGKGIKKLKENNINVIEGINDVIGKELNKRFFLNQKYKMPYIILKWAETKDGFIAKTNGESKWISNDVSRTLVHKWRSEESGILIGVQTAIKDNPKLTVRRWKGNNPIRIIVDPNNRLHNTAKVLKEKPITLIYNTTTTKKRKSNFFIKINPFSIHNIIQDVYKKGISSIMVEGGTKTINYFIDSNLWHEARIFVSNKKFKKGVIAPNLNFENVNKEDINGDELHITNNNEQFEKTKS